MQSEAHWEKKIVASTRWWFLWLNHFPPIQYLCAIVHSADFSLKTQPGIQPTFFYIKKITLHRSESIPRPFPGSHSTRHRVCPSPPFPTAHSLPVLSFPMHLRPDVAFATDDGEMTGTRVNVWVSRVGEVTGNFLRRRDSPPVWVHLASIFFPVE